MLTIPNKLNSQKWITMQNKNAPNLHQDALFNYPINHFAIKCTTKLKPSFTFFFILILLKNKTFRFKEGGY